MIALWFVLAAGITALEAWAAMLIIGALHSNVPEIPAFNYMGSVWLVLLVNILVGMVVGAVAGREK